MKIYVAVLILDEEEYKSMSTVLDYSVADFMSDYWRYLYGFTDNKKIFDKFISYHKGLKKKVVKMDKEEYADFRKENKSSEISIYPFTCGIKHDENKDAYVKVEVMFPCSKNEYVNSVEYASETYYDDIALLACIDPRIFNNKIMDLLQAIDYVDCWMHMYADPDLLDDYLYNQSYCLSFGSGTTMYSTPYISDDIKFNELGIFITLFQNVIDTEKLYEYLLRKDTSDE